MIASERRGPDADLSAFLRWALPRMELRYAGFRNFRGTLRKRISRRVAELGLDGLAEYRARLEADPAEWRVLDAMCRITISRLYRDRGVMNALRDDVLPRAARRGGLVRVWSAGCASGEEPYTIAALWRAGAARAHPEAALEIVATDVDPVLVDRARRGGYGEGSLRELGADLREAALVREGDAWRVRDELRRSIDLRVEDLRVQMPEGPFDVILCRNLAFTYFEPALQIAIGSRLVRRLAPEGVLVVGAHETVPAALDLIPVARCIYAPRPAGT